MDHYLEIRLLPDPEFVPSLLMNALFAKLHRALFDLDSSTIGVSFPDVSNAPKTLGERLRLHSNQSDLQRLMELNWLTGMSDHITTTDPTPIPDSVTYRAVKRIQAKSSPERLRRRLIKRKGIDEETARHTIPDSAAKRVQLPFASIKSRSTGQSFRIFIQHQPVNNEPVDGKFSHYGLSAVATIPWF